MICICILLYKVTAVVFMDSQICLGEEAGDEMQVVTVCDRVGSKPLPIATLRHCMPMVNIEYLHDRPNASHRCLCYVMCIVAYVNTCLCFRSVFLVWSLYLLSPLNCAPEKDPCIFLVSMLHVSDHRMDTFYTAMPLVQVQF